MLSRRLVGPALLIAVAGCHSGGAGSAVVAPTPAPVRATATTPATPTPGALPAAAPGEAPAEWQRLDMASDHIPGISVDRAEHELFAGRGPTHPVVVAVIDGGLDTAQVDLRPELWTNPHPGDDGYPGDVRGWNFIGGPDGRNVHWDTDELTRVAVRCRGQASGRSDPLPPTIAAQCHQIDSEFTRRRSDAEQELQQAQAIQNALAHAMPLLQRAAGPDPLTPSVVAAITPADSATFRARRLYLALAERGITAAMLEEAVTHFRSGLEYGLNPSFDPRPIVGDNYHDVNQSHYGNADVTGPDPEHGTHVSGIIGATRDDHNGVDGIGATVQIMMVRTIPDGDERDKDVANAIRYAVDHGARVINMSFGKGFSPEKPAVDAAVRYADSHGVLMVHAAGNDGADEDQSPDFPNPRYEDGGQAQNWIEVGASSWQGGDSLAAPFSNYSHDRVDVFAPGVDILSTLPRNHFGRESGTSMAAPVVSGLAALLLAYYPSLTASDLKRIILASATRYTDLMVIRPGSSHDEHVPFGSLSVTGGIVNAYAALRIAQEEAASKR